MTKLHTKYDMLLQATYKKTFLYKTNTTNKIRHNYPKTLKSLYIGTPHSPPTRRARKCQTKTELLRTKTEQENGKCRDPTKKSSHRSQKCMREKREKIKMTEKKKYI